VAVAEKSALNFYVGRNNKMAMQWNKDVDAALADSKATKKPLLIDFSAAPA
jgi:hypothetical protein